MLAERPCMQVNQNMQQAVYEQLDEDLDDYL